MSHQKPVQSSMDLVDQNEWDSKYENQEFIEAPAHDQIRRYIEKWIPKKNGSCYEIGCYPGRFLAVFGRMGYELNGADLAPGTDSEMRSWLESLGYRTNSIDRRDVFLEEKKSYYDVVASFGFIEHFNDFESVIKFQLDMVADGGYALITTPNFTWPFMNPLQRLINPGFLKIHNIDSMSPKKWKAVLEKNGFEVLDYRFLGYFEFWKEELPRGVIRIICLKMLQLSLPLLSRVFPKNNRFFSPYCAIVGKRKSYG